MCHVKKGEKHSIFIWIGNYGVSWKSQRIRQVEYPCTCTPYNSFFFIIPSLLGTDIKSGFQEQSSNGDNEANNDVATETFQ